MFKTILPALTAAAIAAGAPVAGATEPPVATGEVRSIDAAAGKITLKHGPIKNLDMDGMTMVFRVKDAAQVQGLKPGDKVRFVADRVDGLITIIRIEKMN